MSSILIDIKDVSFGYGPERSVLNQAHLRLCEGQRLGLTGGNGCGKSTLLKLIVGLLRPGKGSIASFGQNCSTEENFREVRRKIGLLFQDSDDQLFCPTVEEDVAFGPLNIGMSVEAARAVVGTTLESVGLSGFEKRITHHLSGGEKRLVSLAGVLAMQPRILLLDEPVAGLDKESQERITSLLESLPHEMIVVSHDPIFLQRVTTSTCFLSNGNITSENTGK